MASNLQSFLSPLSFSSSPTRHSDLNYRTHFTVRCGPRDNRGPLVKGRILSIEAIQAVQTLKRAHKSLTDDDNLSKTLSRLVKSDLIATFNELLRQDQTELAVKVFSAVRSEFWYSTDLAMYANLVSALARKRKVEDIDYLIRDLDEDEGEIPCDGKGLVMLIKALIGAGRVESTVTIYRMMKRSGWEPSSSADDYVVRVLSSGLRRLGEEKVAEEIVKEFGRANL